MIAAYMRVSTAEQAAGQSVDSQQQSIQRYLESTQAISPGQHFAVFKDEGVSGTTLDRPGLRSLLDACESGEVRVVVVDDPTRLSRARVADTLTLAEKFCACGVEVRCVNGGVFSVATPHEELVTTVLAAMARFQVAETIRKSKDGIKVSRQKHGSWGGGRAVGGNGRRKLSDAEEARLVEMVKCGQPLGAAARKMGVSRNGAAKIIKRRKGSRKHMSETT